MTARRYLLEKRPDRSVEFIGFPNQQLESEVRKHLESLSPFVPPWATSLTVRFDGQASVDFDAMICSQYPYRRLTLTIPSHFASRTVAEKRKILYHEITHPVLSPMAEYFRAILPRLIPEGVDSALFQVIDEAWVEAVETVTQDLSEIFMEADTWRQKQKK